MIGVWLETVIRRRQQRDGFGDPVGDPVEVELEVGIAPRFARSGEDTSEGEVAIVGLTLYSGDFDVDVLASDQIVIAGGVWAGVYDVAGEPGRWKNPITGVEHGTEVHLTRTG